VNNAVGKEISGNGIAGNGIAGTEIAGTEIAGKCWVVPASIPMVISDRVMAMFL
jgi:hypothetical protein